MDVTVDSRQTEHTVWLDVTGEDVPVYESGRSGPFYPTRAVITWTDYHDGDMPEAPRVTLRGVAQVKGGARGKVERKDSYIRAEHWPEWVQRAIIAHAPSWVVQPTAQ